MTVIINGAVCNLTEQTAVGILYPDFAWCKTLAQARKEQEASKRAEQELWNISDYDVFSVKSHTVPQIITFIAVLQASFYTYIIPHLACFVKPFWCLLYAYGSLPTRLP